MPGLLHDRATLYRRLPDGADGKPQQESTMEGTLLECARYLRNEPDDGRDCFFAELTDGKRLSAVEIERIAVEEGA
ncbi:hypothetical protein [Sphingomonas beigongshangi]|uniref:hypothetical protein n=1 Tax=Sphingomonas beigongshangi TaxID=2782540 RepID=UPI00193BEE4D|nr:hypothetical protein [Sphingomonas beigongshangi]